MKADNSIFDDIRPYYESEISTAMQRIADDHLFPMLSSYVYPQRPVDEVRNELRHVSTVEEFQTKMMKSFNEQVIERSISDYSYDGLQFIDKNKSYLYVSNHRDIVLDSCLLQYALFTNGHATTEITFGANLMCTPLIIDIGKSNKMFRVERGGNMREFYRSSLHLSEYIRHTLTEKHESIWIAQRNGRTKDGNDATDQGIIKMFSMSRTDNRIASISELNIVPVSISYEWEPCDVLKALELYRSRDGKYVKSQGEDLNSILTGIFQDKGRVHISICQPITEDDLVGFANLPENEYHKKIATLIDDRIMSHYQLMENNYIAHDMLYGDNRFVDKYDEEQKGAFLHNMKYLEEYEIKEMNVLKQIFLGIYANPIENISEKVNEVRINKFNVK
jgi:hypothetical protein